MKGAANVPDLQAEAYLPSPVSHQKKAFQISQARRARLAKFNLLHTAFIVASASGANSWPVVLRH
jgi:hypothetical protein